MGNHQYKGCGNFIYRTTGRITVTNESVFDIMKLLGEGLGTLDKLKSAVGARRNVSSLLHFEIYKLVCTHLYIHEVPIEPKRDSALRSIYWHDVMINVVPGPCESRLHTQHAARPSLHLFLGPQIPSHSLTSQ
jgi:hypothetical protein